MSADNEARIREAIIDRASDWYVRHREGDLTGVEKQQFLEWLGESLQHTNEYLAIARLSGGFKAAIADLGLHEAQLLERMQASPLATVVQLPGARQRSSRIRMFSMAASVALLVGAVWLAYWLAAPGIVGLPRSIAVGEGEPRRVSLRDGSVIFVNADSTVRIRYTGDERLIELQRGQALFEVAHDPTRPFRVRAGMADVVAIGTQFDVLRRDGQALTVTVLEGKVDVVTESAGAHGVPLETGRSASSYRLGAGEQMRLGVVMTPVKTIAVNARAAAAWVRHEVIFRDETLGDVVDNFNRYARIPIEIENASLRSTKVNGVFNVYDVESFIEFLKQYGVTIERGDDRIHVRR